MFDTFNEAYAIIGWPSSTSLPLADTNINERDSMMILGLPYIDIILIAMEGPIMDIPVGGVFDLSIEEEIMLLVGGKIKLSVN